MSYKTETNGLISLLGLDTNMLRLRFLYYAETWSRDSCSNQTVLKWDQDLEEWVTVYHVEHITLQLRTMLELKWDLYFGIVSLTVPFPFPHKFCLIRALSPSLCNVNIFCIVQCTVIIVINPLHQVSSFLKHWTMKCTHCGWKYWPPPLAPPGGRGCWLNTGDPEVIPAGRMPCTIEKPSTCFVVVTSVMSRSSSLSTWLSSWTPSRSENSAPCTTSSSVVTLVSSVLGTGTSWPWVSVILICGYCLRFEPPSPSSVLPLLLRRSRRFWSSSSVRTTGGTPEGPGGGNGSLGERSVPPEPEWLESNESSFIILRFWKLGGGLERWWPTATLPSPVWAGEPWWWIIGVNVCVGGISAATETPPTPAIQVMYVYFCSNKFPRVYLQFLVLM